MSDLYIYAVARIRSKELGLLDAAFMDGLLAAPDESACLKMLQEKGWGQAGMTTDQILSEQETKTWELMSELVKDMSVFDVFLYQNDYHNLKAAIKEACRGGVHQGIFLSHGTIDPKEIETAIAERDYQRLPEEMRAPAQEAMELLLKTRDGQLCDSCIDRAAMEAIYYAAKKAGGEILPLYGELTVVTANIKVAIRAALTGKDMEFTRRGLIPCDSIDIEELLQAAYAGEEALIAFFERTQYAEAAGELKKSPAEFERWCDNLLIRKIRPQLHNSFGIDPLAAYILARENEIKTVRIILAGKRNDLPEEELRGRIRETYV